jgi:methionyl aminopeptidase
MAMSIKNSREVAKMREAGRVVSVIHERIERAIAPGITTGDLDGIARQTLAELGATSSFLGYGGGPGRRPFPGHICASVNDVIVHGIPGKRVLKEGDIISVDVGAILDGYHGDSAWTYPVGAIAPEARRLLEDTEASLYRAVAGGKGGRPPWGRRGGGRAVRGGPWLRAGREYGGHGIGRSMHEDPHVPNHGDPTRGVLLRTGLTLAIEPMLTTGGAEWQELNDGWTVVTADGSLAAHFEHTVVVTATGGEILTERLPVPVQ